MRLFSAVCSSGGEQSFVDERLQGELVCRQCRRSHQRHSVVPVSSSSFSASFPVHFHLHSLEPQCTRSSLPENTYFLLGGDGRNVQLDSRAGISTTRKFYYSAIHFICSVWCIQAGRPIISFRLLLYAYWRFGARVAASFLTPLIFH